MVRYVADTSIGNKLIQWEGSNHLMKKRNVDKYTVSRCLGKRYAVSAVPSMQRLLNNDHRKQKQALKSLMSPTNYASNGFYCWDNKPILLLLLLVSRCQEWTFC